MSSAIPLLIVGLAAVGASAAGASGAGDSARPRVVLDTSLGPIVLELNAEAAPKTVANFIEYVESGHYDGTIFHRVIDGFMIQAGGFTADMQQKPTREPIANEADNGLKNARGTIAMARTMNPDSASAQFFINTANNRSLNHRDKSIQGWGYAVFGEVVEGMEVVSAISGVKTTGKAGHQDVPVEAVVINSAKMAAAEAAE
ncbi:MAG: peptidylprolyl isomerase [Acidobacteriota bacterium]